MIEQQIRVVLFLSIICTILISASKFRLFCFFRQKKQITRSACNTPRNLGFISKHTHTHNFSLVPSKRMQKCFVFNSPHRHALPKMLHILALEASLGFIRAYQADRGGLISSALTSS